MVKKILLLATRNKGKEAEFKAILKNNNLKILFLDNVKMAKQDVKETGRTYFANALIKAKFYGDKSGFLTLADDTGLEVAALPGKLGVKSKRFLKDSDQGRVNKLLAEMKGVSGGKRAARFVCVAVLYQPKSNNFLKALGICQGRIGLKPKGNDGFGYDSVFVVKGLGKTMAQLTLKEKNKISHRAKALKKLKKYLIG